MAAKLKKMTTEYKTEMDLKKQLKSNFPNRVWRRGEDYFYQERVELLGRSDSSLHYQVLGRKKKLYSVHLSPNLLQGKLKGSCDCPYDDKCKHMVAAILYELDISSDTSHGFPGLVNRFQFHDQDSEWQSELEDPNPPQKHALLKLLDADTLKRNQTVDSDKTYTPCFLLERERAGTFTERWKIDLYSRYIKKDGTPGAIIRYNPTHNMIFSLEASRSLFDEALKIADRRLAASEWLPFCLDAGVDLLIQKNTHGALSPILPSRIEEIEISFDPTFSSALNWGQYQSRISLWIKGQDQGLLTSSPSATIVHCGFQNVFIEVSHGIIANLDELKSLEMIVFENIIKMKEHWIHKDVLDLKKRIGEFQKESGSLAILKVKVPSQKIQLEPAQPVFCLYLHGDYHGQVDLRVEYEGNESFLLGELTPWKDEDSDNYYFTVNETGEKQFLKRLESLDLEYVLAGISRGRVHYAGEFDAFLIKFMDHFSLDIEEGRVKVMVESRSVLPVRSGDIRIEFSSGIDWLKLKVMVSGEEIDLRARDLLDGVLKSSKGYHVLTEDMKDDFLSLLSNSKASDELILHRFDVEAGEIVSRWASGEDKSSKSPAFDLFLSMKESWERLKAEEDLPVPPEFKGFLRDYQEKGLNWLRFLRSLGAGGILGDDMGLGKTIQMIVFLADIRRDDPDSTFLVIAPVSTLGNWKRELKRFLPSEKVTSRIGPERSEKLATGGTLLTSYQTMLRDFESLGNNEFSLIVLDEGQVLKNNRTKIHRAVKELKTPQKIILSGTPVENSLMDLWSLMEVVNPGMLGSRKSFKGRWVPRKGFEAGVDYSRLQDRIRSFFLRRTKDMIAAELPEKEEILISVSPSEKETEFYQRQEKLCRQEVLSLLGGADSFKANIAILQSLSLLRQAAIAPELCGGPSVSAKLDFVTSKINEAVEEGHSVLVFSQFVRVLGLMQDRLKVSDIAYRYFDGSFSAAKRSQIIDEFNHKDDSKVFLISLKAGGVGINLVKADYVFLIDPWWNPAVETQAIDRSHRIGQERKVFAYRFIVENTIEEKVLELQNKKRDLIKNLFGSDQSLFARLSQDDILALFQEA